MQTPPKPSPPSPEPPVIDERGLPEGYNFRPDWEVTPRQVKAMRDANESFVFVDCRTAPEYDVAHLEGTQLLPLQQMSLAVEELDEHKDERIVVHCHHGGRSLQMTAALREQGFMDVKSMAGGIEVWSRDIDARVPRY